jgi:hypothetical protein
LNELVNVLGYKPGNDEAMDAERLSNNLEQVLKECVIKKRTVEARGHEL